MKNGFIRNFQEIEDKINLINGYLVPGQEEFLFNKIKSLPDDAVILEIGSFQGRSTVAMGYACKGTNKKIYCIDPWERIDSNSGKCIYEIWNSNIKLNGLEDYIKPLRGLSNDIIPRLKNMINVNLFDFAFIGGSHEYNDILKDFYSVYPIIKEGGWIALHDVVHTWPGPNKVWHQEAKWMLRNHEYSTTLACGQKVSLQKTIKPLIVIHIQEIGLREQIEPVVLRLYDNRQCNIAVVVPDFQLDKYLKSSNVLYCIGPSLQVMSESEFLKKNYHPQVILSQHPETPSAVAQRFNNPEICKIVMQHGLSDKAAFYNKKSNIKDPLGMYDIFFLTGPVFMEGSMREFAGVNPETFSRLQFYSIGSPKTDSLVQCQPNRIDILQQMGLDPKKPVVCYAPTFEKTASLQQNGMEIIKALAELNVNVIVKLHHVSMKSPEEEEWVVVHTDGVKWKEIIQGLEITHPNLKLAEGQDANPYLSIADVLISDASGVAYEYLTLNRPVIFYDCPKLFEIYGKKGIHFWGRESGDIVKNTKELICSVKNAIANPQYKKREREEILGRLAYSIGDAAERASETILFWAGIRNGLDINKIQSRRLDIQLNYTGQQNSSVQDQDIFQAVSFDVPILLMIYNRTESTRRVFETIRQIKPKNLFVAADGPKKDNSTDNENCIRTREIIKTDWDCNVHTLYRDKNLGCKNAISSAINWFFENVEEGIILEDDTLCDLSFFPYCREMLHLYRNNHKIMHISGDNFQFGRIRGEDSYYFSNYGHIWGWATWRRAWEKYDLNLDGLSEFLSSKKMNQITTNIHEQEYWCNIFSETNKGKIDTWDYQWQFSIWNNDGLAILPNQNLVSNIGFNNSSTHTSSNRSKLANLPSHSLKITSHPVFILRNQQADEFTFEYIFQGKVETEDVYPRTELRNSSSEASISRKSADISKLADEAKLFFEKRELNSAFRILNEIKSYKLPYQNIDLMRGICFLEMNQIHSAVESLKEELRYFPENTNAKKLLDGVLSENKELFSFKIDDDEFINIFRQIKDYTMLSEERLYSLYELTRKVCLNNIPGNIIECGVASGGSSALMALVIKKYSTVPRTLFAFDSFDGMPEPSEEDTHQGKEAGSTGWGKGTCAAPVKSLEEICRKLDVWNIVTPVKGYFEETLPQYRRVVGTVSLLHMDGDWYSSTKTILHNLYDCVMPGGYIQVDDYGFWDGCKKAVHEFEVERKIKFELNEIDSTGVWFNKTESEGSTVNLSSKENYLKYLNLGCGGHFHKEWVNVDINGADGNVFKHDLNKGIPFADNSFKVVYHSHLLEHFKKEYVPIFLKECCRVLEPQGILRIAVPDLEQIILHYIDCLNKAVQGDEEAKKKYDWIMLELFDQMVRNCSGGNMQEYLNRENIPAEQYVLERLGDEAKQIIKKKKEFTAHKKPGNSSQFNFEASAPLENNNKDNDPLLIGNFRLGGEVHQWMYDRFSLTELLKNAGFCNIKICRADESSIPEFNKYRLDINADGEVRKPDSLFIEAEKNTEMKVIHLCMQDYGGAGKAAYRLHKGLEKAGADSKFLVLNKKTNDNSIRVIPAENMEQEFASVSIEKYTSELMDKQWSKWGRMMSSFPDRPQGLEIFTDGESDLRLDNLRDLKQCDIINMHWVAGMIDYGNIAYAFANHNVIWTLHDMNPFTGGCHYAGSCKKYLDACGSCPQLGSNDENDISRKIWVSKFNSYRHLNIQIVTPSKWLSKCVSESSLMKQFPVEVIPYGFPLDIFKPGSKEEIRKKYGISSGLRVILFGADQSTDRKGFSFLKKALDILMKKGMGNDLLLATFGYLNDEQETSRGFKMINFGSISSEQHLAEIYSLADVFVIPSLEDNLPNVVPEAMACGVPVVGFDIGGIPDMISHKEDGYLAKYKDEASLAEGIEWILFESGYAGLSANCRTKAISQYSLEHQAEKYKEIYKKVIGNNALKTAKGSDLNRLQNLQAEYELSKGNIIKAKQMLQSILADDPDFIGAYNNIILACISDKDYNEAHNYLNKALQICPENDITLKYKNILQEQIWIDNLLTESEEKISQKEYHDALVILNEVLKVSPVNIQALNNLAVVQFIKKDYSAAKESVIKILKLEPENLHAKELYKSLEHFNNPGITSVKSKGKNKDNELEETRKNWEEFGKDDPLWAILTLESKKNNKWQLEEFFRTGRNEISEVMSYIRSLDFPLKTGRTIDFGCGVGRLTQALCDYFDECLGIDIADSMINLANQYNRYGVRCNFVVNTNNDLNFLPDNTIDFIYSNIVLQHNKPKHSIKYIQEFIRVISPGGLVIFQLPSGAMPSDKSKYILPGQAFTAKIVVLDKVEKAAAGEQLSLKVKVKNMSGTTWPAIDNTIQQIRLGNHWWKNGSLISLDDGRIAIPDSLKPGEESELILSVSVPKAPGNYILELDMVQEGVAWFKEKGSETTLINLEVIPNEKLHDPANPKRKGENSENPTSFQPKMEMNVVPIEKVIEVVEKSGGTVVDIVEDNSAGGLMSYRYCITKKDKNQNSINRGVGTENFKDFTYSKISHFNHFIHNEIHRNADKFCCDLKVYQDLLIYNFIIDNIKAGSKILEIGGGNSRIINALKTKYEFWNLDKFEGIGNGPVSVCDSSGYHLVKDYIGNFNSSLPENYFDLVFSISTLEHVEESEENYRNITSDINRLLKNSGLSVHCLDSVLKADHLWKNGLIDYIYKHLPVINENVEFEKLLKDNDLYVMNEISYKNFWQMTTKIPYSQFGKPISWNILWRK